MLLDHPTQVARAVDRAAQRLLRPWAPRLQQTPHLAHRGDQRFALRRCQGSEQRCASARDCALQRREGALAGCRQAQQTLPGVAGEDVRLSQPRFSKRARIRVTYPASSARSRPSSLAVG